MVSPAVNRSPTGKEHLIAGFFGGLIPTAVLYPLELIKTRMQVEVSRYGSYRNISSSLRAVFKNEGLRGFYQGMTPAIIGACGSWGGYFYFYEMAKKRRMANLTVGETKLKTADHLLAGTEAGVILVLLFNPLWLTKTRLALQGVTKVGRPYTGFVDCLVTIVREEGVLGLYKGVVPALFLTSHGAIQFASYEWLKSQSKDLRASGGDQPAWVSVLIGAAAKIFASTLTYPYQVVKSRLQQRDSVLLSTSESSSNLNVKSLLTGKADDLAQPRYTGTIDCVMKIWRNEGVLGFFRGVFPNALKVAPSAALTFLVYEECIKLLLSPVTPEGESFVDSVHNRLFSREGKRV